MFVHPHMINIFLLFFFVCGDRIKQLILINFGMHSTDT